MSASHDAEVLAAVEERLAQFKALTFEKAETLQSSSEDDRIFGGRRYSVTVFSQRNAYNLKNTVLITVLMARKGFLGGHRYERGLVFAPDGTVREATDVELRDSGG